MDFADPYVIATKMPPRVSPDGW